MKIATEFGFYLIKQAFLSIFHSCSQIRILHSSTMGSTSNYLGCDFGIMSKAQAKKILYSNNLINPVGPL